MKTNLTLKSSSMLFFGKVNLLRNVPVEVETEELSLTSIKMINKFIKSGAIVSTEGLIEAPEALEEKLETPVELTLETEVAKETEQSTLVEEKQEEIVEAKEEVVEKVKEEPAKVEEEIVQEVKEAPKKTTKKATTKKATTEAKAE